MANVFFQWIAVGAMSILHPYFISMTDVNFNNKAKELEISVRIFTDDFENTLAKNYPGKIDILHPVDQDKMNTYVKDYIQTHLQFTVNNAKVQMNFAGYEKEGESIWSYFEVKAVDKVSEIKVFNNLLHDYTDKQINMLHFQVNKSEQSYKLDYPNVNASFKF